MKTFIGTKLIKAIPMTREAYNQLRGWTVPEDENPEDAGYLVEYLDGGQSNHPDFDGYISWSPEDVFDRAYQQTEGMDFGMAVNAMKLGKKVARKGWNGSGMFAYYVPAAHYKPNTSVLMDMANDKGLIPHREYMAIKTAQGDIATWAPSGSDSLATDWHIVE